jgi:FecR protein
MKRLIFVLYLFAPHLAALEAEPFEQAEVTKAINIVSLLPDDRRAVAGDVVKGNTGLKTGGDSRAELQFPDFTITRLGSNSLFRFVAGTREMILDSGTLLFSAPEGAGGGKVQAAAITAAVTGSDFMISNVGRVKVICLSHKVTVYLTENPKIRAELLPGQMLDITPGPTGTIRKMPRVTTINLGKLLATSKLTEAGGFRPLASQAILVQNTDRQAKAFSLAKTDLTSEAAEEVRITNQFASNSSSQSRQAAAAQTAREAEEATSASSTVNTENRGNRGNVENRGNSGNNGNLGNSGNNENRGNRGNTENRGNSGDNENRGNRGNVENRGNSGDNENRGNRGNVENRGNSGNTENRGNRGNVENRGNSGNNENPGNRANNGNRGAGREG